MLYRSRLLALAALIGVCSACDSRPRATLRLPTGDIERGKRAFVDLNCHSCHQVQGGDMPTPYVHPVVPVKLGGPVGRRLSDSYLVSAMLNPDYAYHLAPYPIDQITSDGKPRMPHYAGRMTTQQMVDIVAFLQSRYKLARW